MPVETLLTRELEIRFIDARFIVNEAKVSLGILGYPSKTELRSLRQEAMRLFEERPECQKLAMRRAHSDLEDVKSTTTLLSASASCEMFSDASNSSRSLSHSVTSSNCSNHRGRIREWLSRRTKVP